MMSYPHLYNVAGIGACKPVLIQPILMSIIFEHYKQLHDLENATLHLCNRGSYDFKISVSILIWMKRTEGRTRRDNIKLNRLTWGDVLVKHAVSVPSALILSPEFLALTYEQNDVHDLILLHYSKLRFYHLQYPLTNVRR